MKKSICTSVLIAISAIFLIFTFSCEKESISSIIDERTYFEELDKIAKSSKAEQYSVGLEGLKKIHSDMCEYNYPCQARLDGYKKIYSLTEGDHFTYSIIELKAGMERKSGVTKSIIWDKTVPILNIAHDYALKTYSKSLFRLNEYEFENALIKIGFASFMATSLSAEEQKLLKTPNTLSNQSFCTHITPVSGITKWDNLLHENNYNLMIHDCIDYEDGVGQDEFELLCDVTYQFNKAEEDLCESSSHRQTFWWADDFAMREYLQHKGGYYTYNDGYQNRWNVLLGIRWHWPFSIYDSEDYKDHLQLVKLCNRSISDK